MGSRWPAVIAFVAGVFEQPVQRGVNFKNQHDGTPSDEPGFVM
jgi:hypothetical protein